MMGKLVLLSFLLLGFQRSREQATVSITLVDNLGSLIPQNVTPDFKLTNRGNRRMVFTSRRPVFENVPYGEYDLHVLPGQGFGFAQRIVHVNRRDVWVIVGLPVGSAESPHGRDIVGKVVRLRQVGLAWVKLVALYSDVMRETRLDSGGSFRLTDVPFGDYALIVLRDGRICDMRTVQVIAEPKNLDVELSSTNPCK